MRFNLILYNRHSKEANGNQRTFNNRSSKDPSGTFEYLLVIPRDVIDLGLINGPHGTTDLLTMKSTQPKAKAISTHNFFRYQELPDFLL